MVAAHRYYRAAGYYDYPQRQWTNRLVNAAIGAGMKLPATRDRTHRAVMKLRLAQYKPVVGEE